MVVYIDDLTKCHRFNLALRLTLTESMKRKKQTKGRAETNQKYEKEKQKPRFLPKWKDAFKWVDTAY